MLVTERVIDFEGGDHLDRFAVEHRGPVQPLLYGISRRFIQRQRAAYQGQTRNAAVLVNDGRKPHNTLDAARLRFGRVGRTDLFYQIGLLNICSHADARKR